MKPALRMAMYCACSRKSPPANEEAIMKKLITALLALTLTLSLCGCENKEYTEEKELFSYEYNDGTLTLKIIDTDSVLEKR